MERAVRHRAALRHTERTDIEGARALVANGCIAVVEGANMPTTLTRRATCSVRRAFVPGKAANAGGVAVRHSKWPEQPAPSWSFEEVDSRLQSIMAGSRRIGETAAITDTRAITSGANIAGFEKIADAMMSQGVV